MIKKTKESINSQAQIKKSGALKKYIGLLIYISLFSLITLGMLGLGIYNTRTAAANNQIINITNEMENAVQRLSKNIMDIDIYLNRELKKNPERGWVGLSAMPQAAQQQLEEIKELRGLLDRNLEALKNGGSLRSSHGGAEFTVSALGENSREHLLSAHKIWQLYKGFIDSMLNDSDQLGLLYAHNSDFLVDYSRRYSPPLLTNLGQITEDLVRQVAEQARFFERLQYAAMALAALIFLLIIFRALRQLFRNDAALAVASQEMYEIMSSVNEGLFLVDRDLNIGNQYSARLVEILGRRDIAGQNLLDILQDMVGQEELETTKVFIDQLYSEWVVEDLIDDLNPLRRICLQREGLPDKYLDFKFFRVIHNGVIERVLVNVSDSTELVLLQESQRAQKEQEGQELEMLNIILNTNGTVLSNFIRESRSKLEEINRALKAQGASQRELKDKVVQIARLMHTIKGEASSIKLTRMVHICETFEDNLAVMKNAHMLRGQDFLGLVVWLEDLFRMFDILGGYSQRLNGDGPAVKNISSQESISSYFRKFVQDIALRNQKKVALQIDGFDGSPFDEELLNKLRAIAIQLLRNSVVHGIESPEERRARGKSEIGTVKLHLYQDGGGAVLELEDDGNGIDFNAIRQRAIAEGRDPAEVQAMGQQQLYNLMFSSGFSTAREQTEDAGRGMGMDIIKDSVKELGGRINVATEAGRFTRFKFNFPQ